MKIKIPGTLYKIGEIFNENGFESYLVGGAVRDILLGKEVTDYDIATNAKPEEVRKIFRKVIPTGIKHGTVTILFGRFQIETTTYRIEGKYTDKRRPESVTFAADITEDLSRRDFSINAIAYNLVTRKLTDPFEGQKDLKRGIIKAIGVPEERFNEDGLRLMRACRFAAQLDYNIEENTFHAIKKTAGNLACISMERIRDELMKILASGHPVKGLELIRETGMLKYFLPELEKCYGLGQRERHQFDVYYHSLYACEGAPREMPEIRMAALLHDLGKAETIGQNEAGENTFYGHQKVSSEMADVILRRLKFPNKFREDICHLILHHMWGYTPEWSDTAVRRMISKVGVEHIKALIELRKADKYGRERKAADNRDIIHFIDRMQTVVKNDTALSIKDLALSGKDLMEHLEIPPGKVVGTILDYLLQTVIDDPEANDRERLLETGKRFYRERLEI